MDGVHRAKCALGFYFFEDAAKGASVSHTAIPCDGGPQAVHKYHLSGSEHIRMKLLCLGTAI